MYPTERGICFLLSGSLTFQERVNTPDRWNNPGGVPSAGAYFVPMTPTAAFRDLVLVEGPTDALRLWAEYGLDAAAYLGTFIPDARLENLRRIKPNAVFWIIPDNDGPGFFGLRKLMKEFPAARVLWLPSQYKDVCAVPKQELSRLLAAKGLI